MADHLRQGIEVSPRGPHDTASVHSWLRSQLRSSSGRLLGSGYQATAYLYDGPFGKLVVKKAHDSTLLGRISRRAIRREQRIYERLRGVVGVPRSFGLVDGRHLVLQHVDGQSLRLAESALTDRTRFYDRLLETVEAMHRAGVAHGDLKRKDNILVGPEERPFVIDFGVARVEEDGASRWRRWLFGWFKQSDYNAWVKLKYRRRFEELSGEDRARYRPLMLERVARAIRIPAQKVTMRHVRKDRKARRGE